MIVALIIQIALVALVVFGIRAIRSRRTGAPFGQQLRNVFQYLVLLVLVFASTSGVAGLLGMVLDRADFVSADSSELALNLSLVLVGLPLLIVTGRSTLNRVSRDPAETSSTGWTLFATIALIATLTVSLFAAYAVLRVVFGATDYDGFAFAQVAVWGAAWAVIDRFDRRHAAGRRADFRHVVLALIGLVLGAVAVGRLVAALLDRVVPSGTSGALLVDDTSPIINAFALLLIASPVWIRYWVRGLSTAFGTEGWHLHVVLFGVAGGLITATVSGATILYSVAVWFLGTPRESDVADHFSSLPGAIGAAAAGLIVWAYHRSVLASQRRPTRSEVDRTYLYVMAVGGLLAGAVGTVILFGAFIEALTGTALLAGDPVINTLLLAVVLLVIGVPVWWMHWREATALRATGAPDEIDSLSRRIYLVSLIGVGGLVALGTGIATVYLFLRDAIDGALSSSTARSLRFPLSTLLTAGAIALYHLGYYRADHATRDKPVADSRPRRIVLVGPHDEVLEQRIREIGNFEIEYIVTGGDNWPREDALIRLRSSTNDVVLVRTESGVYLGMID